MKIKSTVWQWLAAGCGVCGLLAGIGAEGTAQTAGQISTSSFTTAFILILLALLFLRFSFAAQDREKRECHRYGWTKRFFKRSGFEMRWYTVYDHKTEEILASGTAQQCADALGLSVGSFYCAVTRSNAQQNLKYDFVKEDIEEWDLE